MNRLSKIFIVVGILLINISVSFLILNQYKELDALKQSEMTLDIIKQDIEEVSENDDSNGILVNNEMLTTNINGYDYIGTISIPILNLELPVMSSYDYKRLDIAPCRYYGSIHTNDLIICAHSYKAHFKYLDKLKQKDLIILTDVMGNNYVYEVLEIEILNPNQVSEMINNDFDLTLYTCTKDGLNRITVRCNRIIDYKL